MEFDCIAKVGRSIAAPRQSWGYGLSIILPRTKQHHRSWSSTNRSSNALANLPKSYSTPALTDMAATVAAPPGPALTFDKPPTSEMVYAVREDQTESPTYTPPETASTPQAPLDLNSEVTVLSNKLVNAINFQTNLDDSLAAARHELEGCKERIRQLEAENAEYRDKITSGILVRREDVEAENAELRESLERAKHQRAAVEREKKAIELELENLTTALFEEANEVWLATHVN